MKTAASQLKEVTSVVAKVNALKKRLRTDDTIDVFTIPKDMELDAMTNYWLPSANTSAVDLLKDYCMTDFMLKVQLLGMQGLVKIIILKT